MTTTVASTATTSAAPTNTMAGGRTRVAVPTFNQERFESYLSQIKAWRVLCGLPAKEQGVLLWYTLPDDHPSDIKDKIMDEIGLEALLVDTGVDVFIEKMEMCHRGER